MTCRMNMIKLLLIYFTFVVEKDQVKKRGNSLGKDFEFISPARGNSNLILYYFVISRLFCTCQVELVVMIMMMLKFVI